VSSPPRDSRLNPSTALRSETGSVLRETRPESTSEREPAASPQGQIEAIALVFEGHRWTVTDGETRVHVPDTKGMRYVANLVARSETERHVLDLVDAVEGLDPHARTARRRLGDAGELLDARARTEYRREIGPLRSDIDDALQFGNDVRAPVLQEQLDQLSRQLLAAFGLGGRGRRAASASERARVNVTRASVPQPRDSSTSSPIPVSYSTAGSVPVATAPTNPSPTTPCVGAV
jgi:hypothetical protein